MYLQDDDDDDDNVLGPKSGSQGGRLKKKMENKT